MSASRQLTLDLALRPALGRDDFLVAPPNAAAVAMIDQWPDWPSPVALLVGPPGSGKSHLAEVWRQASRAERIAASELRTEAVPRLLASGALAVEDVEPGRFDEAALFHLFNHVRAGSGSLLMTAQHGPSAWGVRLPDLRSRLKTVAIAELGGPDDVLLRGVLVKLFGDHQLAVEESVIAYLVNRMPRSLAAARELVAAIDRAALVEKADITRPFAARVLRQMAAPDTLDDDS